MVPKRRHFESYLKKKKWNGVVLTSFFFPCFSQTSISCQTSTLSFSLSISFILKLMNDYILYMYKLYIYISVQFGFSSVCRSCCQPPYRPTSVTEKAYQSSRREPLVELLTVGSARFQAVSSAPMNSWTGLVMMKFLIISLKVIKKETSWLSLLLL